MQEHATKDHTLITELQSQKLSLFPQDSINLCNLKVITKDEKVLAEVCKGMHGLKQASKLAYDNLKLHLVSYGYTPIKFTPGLWTHKPSRLTFALIVNDFSMKYTNRVQAQALANAL